MHDGSTREIPMNDEMKKIIAAAKDLSRMLSEHPVALRYGENLSAMNRDAEARDLLDRLIRAGQKLNEMAQGGGDMRLERSEENERLCEELAGSGLVKEFIASQKAYLKLVQAIIEKIRNPDPGGH
jgi:cell fate (sporulation/competence/biofilm development) regulator YlbF (YheA/YmcA/DUF963 family)